jgi:hypothetical protein
LRLIQRAVLKDWKARLRSFLTLEMIYDLVNYNAGSEFKCEPSFQFSEMKLGHRDQAVDGSQSARRELLPAGTIAKMTPNRSALFESISTNGFLP